MRKIHVFNPAKGNKWLYTEMVRNQRTEGELDIGRNGMEYVLGILTHLNNASGKTFVADSTIAKQAGWTGNSHGFKEVRKTMVESGYLYVWGVKRRAYEVSLLVPDFLAEQYEELFLDTRKVQVDTEPSRIWELTQNSVLSTQNPGLKTRDSEAQDSVTHDPQGREGSEGEISTQPTEGRKNRPSGLVPLSSSVGTGSSYSSEPSSDDCGCTYDTWWRRWECATKDPFESCLCPCGHPATT
ncbi:hypothetical protein ACFY12_02460 [Streptomyces sp. NPDC001339]|uniref:hypothetical protein n=1 Tax=Streptomyces sp. NPDC001339 TaxID=3364563 RepID=UPI00369E454F